MYLAHHDAYAHCALCTHIYEHRQAIEHFPDSVFRPGSRLIVLGLEDTRLSMLPSTIDSLQSLRTLRIGRAIVADRFPLLVNDDDRTSYRSSCATDLSFRCTAMEDFVSADRTTRVNVTFNITPFVLPASLQFLPVKDLTLHNLGLTEVPRQVLGLSRLEFLMVKDNLVTRVPEALSELQTIMGLDFNNNLLQEWPSHLSRLTQLRELRVSGNPRLPSGPPTWDGQGWDAMDKFMGNDNRWNQVPAFLASKWRTFQRIGLMYNNLSSDLPGYENTLGNADAQVFLRGNPVCEAQPIGYGNPDPCGQCPRQTVASLPIPGDERGRVLLYYLSGSRAAEGSNTTRTLCPVDATSSIYPE